MNALGKQPGRIPLPQQDRQAKDGKQRPQVGRSRSSQMLNNTVSSGVSPIINPISVAPSVCAA